MTKQELMETYTAEQLAEMVVDLQNIPTAGKISCENSGNGDLIKVKCDKCREDFISFLDDKYILCTKAELFSTREMNNTLKRETERLQYENENCRKALREEMEKHELQIVEYRNEIDELKQKLEIQETAAKYAEEYVNSLKCSVDRKQDAINQIDGIICELFGIAHNGDIYSDDFKELLREKSAVGKTITDFLPTEPIKVADMLINAEGEYEHNPLAKALCGEDKGTYRIFDIGKLRQIAEHLFVYCNHYGEEEE